MKKLLLLITGMLIAISAFAVVDPDDDMMGFYFDFEADNPWVDGIPPYSQVPMHLILTRPTADFIYGFEAGHHFVGEGMILAADFAAPNIINVGDNMNLIVGFGDPYPTSSATLLVTFTVMYMDTTMAPVEFFLHGSDPSSINPLYPVILLADGVLQSVGLSFGQGSCAVINGGGCGGLPVDKVSIDQVKSLYR